MFEQRLLIARRESEWKRKFAVRSSSHAIGTCERKRKSSRLQLVHFHVHMDVRRPAVTGEVSAGREAG
ncbi:hypothetical protein, partial [Streptomyces sp. NPDC096030]|uniref:hypothetical protein n=1 Tax=Streptomyces sp. NPDC096030 TaxID=3155423 RepID=UPI00332CEA04